MKKFTKKLLVFQWLVDSSFSKKKSKLFLIILPTSIHSTCSTPKLGTLVLFLISLTVSCI